MIKNIEIYEGGQNGWVVAWENDTKTIVENTESFFTKVDAETFAKELENK